MTEKAAPEDDRIITNAMLRAQDQERIELLEGLLREVEVGVDDYWRTTPEGKAIMLRILAVLEGK